ncbi:hypothetical protein ACWF62_17815 [Rhodococcus sp. NPDC054953]
MDITEPREQLAYLIYRWDETTVEQRPTDAYDALVDQIIMHSDASIADTWMLIYLTYRWDQETSSPRRRTDYLALADQILSAVAQPQMA